MTREPAPFPRLLEWLASGTSLLHTQLSRADEAWVTGPSTLPGWRNAHLLTHVARNADALTNLVTWAATGVETPMYPHGTEGCLRDIEEGARRTAQVILKDVKDSAVRLQQALDELPVITLGRTVRTAQGRLVAASLIPWLRIREVWIHLVDLGTGVTFEALPEDLAEALLPDVVTTLAGRDGCPALIVPAPAGGLPLTTRPTQPLDSAIEVKGSTAELLGWLTGRTTGDGLTCSPPGLPALPAWL
ncbi:maleylpyruvate isomerase family mycothiol-dependent enzyme [Streptomyces yaanensis]|uniref:Maleylpyruvate isomerase family mycothiol-dependent enzyme n=1 Tax=Streptomyces yaanensis TaxID=1142239 RepID=A0ABV7SKL4_9ACTN|nr:maleylpyruvate isomerase family mycothiol-dependent enzyme [Streptomyces sp. CGMCC 4.7035]WNC00344.1 maleylpyruvate isomerase family mycothiol-dependent enzyme [Streptomyces sp. CGMCC 4.7035]